MKIFCFAVPVGPGGDRQLAAVFDEIDSWQLPFPVSLGLNGIIEGDV